MRNTLTGLLLLLPLPAAASIAHSVQIAVSAPACAHRSNRAQAVAKPSSGAHYAWSISNGTIASGQGTPNVEFVPNESGTATLVLRIDWPDESMLAQTNIPVFGPPDILQQPQNATAPLGGFVTLTVMASDEAATYDWYEGVSGDTSKFMFTGGPEFTTPPLRKSTSYWVRVSNVCESADSKTVTVTVLTPRRRAVH